MQASELRIGNRVLIPYQNAPIAIPAHETTVQGITIFGEVLTNNTPEHEGLKTHINHVSGIPLTEEWLLKFGFEKDDSGGEINDPDYCEWYQKEFPIIGELCQSSDKSYLFDTETDTLRIKYVHQLQNLYFALTGTELTIK